MRMRVKKWARPELDASPYYVADPEGTRGGWAARFPKAQPIYLELGCGKGVSTCRMALEDPAHNYLAVDLITSVLGVARRNAEEAYRGVRNVDNLILTSFHIEYIYKYLSEQDRVARIYISFCNPWDKRPKQAKHRLTHPRQLRQYRAFLEDGGEIWFKTDDDRLFDDSVEYFTSTGFEIVYQTRDLHASGFAPNYESEHEKMFDAEGVPIKFLIAVKRPLDGEVFREYHPSENPPYV